MCTSYTCMEPYSGYYLADVDFCQKTAIVFKRFRCFLEGQAQPIAKVRTTPVFAAASFAQMLQDLENDGHGQICDVSADVL